MSSEPPAALGVEDLVALPGGRVSLVWRCRRDGREVCVRLTPWFRKLDEVRYECAVLEAVHADGGPVAVPVGEPIIDQAGVWSTFGWIDGQPINGACDAAEIGALLSERHAHTDRLVSMEGGRFTDHQGGGSPAKNGGLYSNANVHDALLGAINKRLR